ncbi:nuclear transport factor 2 family protein [uncultured Roseibium sp.]|uniref:nuclear transport factor 2 family protein n=1 Tax=uncultured Roseibium sp. TaxID=1936171 RepID=UPI0026128F7B|nr:nuclear transport factor 2 family protein [uncultured Roseibium sp.]
MSLEEQLLLEMPEEARIVRDYLDASMKPDPDLAATFVADNVVITFTGGRVFKHPSGPTAFNAGRYSWVKKKMDTFDVATGGERTVVYSVGTLYGEWPDGTPFEGNRYVDRFEVEDGKIVRMDVWNDSAERILTRMSIKA